MWFSLLLAVCAVDGVAVFVHAQQCDTWSNAPLSLRSGALIGDTFACTIAPPYFSPLWFNSLNGLSGRSGVYSNTSTWQYLIQPNNVALECYVQNAANAAILLETSDRPAYCRFSRIAYDPGARMDEGPAPNQYCNYRGYRLGTLSYNTASARSVFTPFQQCVCDRNTYSSDPTRCTPVTTSYRWEVGSSGSNTQYIAQTPTVCDQLSVVLGIAMSQQPNRASPFCTVYPSFALPELQFVPSANLLDSLLNEPLESFTADASAFQRNSGYIQLVRFYVRYAADQSAQYRARCVYAQTFPGAIQRVQLAPSYINDIAVSLFCVELRGLGRTASTPSNAEPLSFTHAIAKHASRFVLSLRVEWLPNQQYNISADAGSALTQLMCNPRYYGTQCDQQCNPICSTVPHSHCEAAVAPSTGSTCVCNTGYTRVALAQPDPLSGQLYQCRSATCPPGYVSPQTQCLKRIQPCVILGATTNPLTGECDVCIDTHARVNVARTACTRQHCNSDANGQKCTGRGVCTSTLRIEYCSCESGYDGLYCERTAVVAATLPVITPINLTSTTCDCGVQWTTFADPITQFPFAVAPYNPGVPFISTQQAVFANVRSDAHADWMCYQDAACDGYSLTLLSFTDRQALEQRMPTYPRDILYRAYFFTLIRTDLRPETRIFSANMLHADRISQRVRWINRILDMPCALDVDSPYRTSMMSLLDTDFYTRTYPNQVLGLCAQLPEFLRVDPVTRVAQCFNPSGAAVRHFQFTGHQLRYAPRASCRLDALPFRAAVSPGASQCTQYLDGCVASLMRVNGAAAASASGSMTRTCSGHGYCDATPGFQTAIAATTDTLPVRPYRCNCAAFSRVLEDSPLFGVAQYTGVGCQYDIRQYCAPVESTVICNGLISRCAPRRVFTFDGTTSSNQIVDFTTLPIDYVPSCRCDDASLSVAFPAIAQTGQYCEATRCARDPVFKCQSLGPSAGACQFESASLSWQCACTERAVGDRCEISAQACLFNSIKCSGQGKCIASSATAVCQCNSNQYYGPQCQLQACTDDILVAGHGLCNNGRMQACYPPYTGSRCEFDTCALSNGTVAPGPNGSPPIGCQCPEPYSSASRLGVNGDVTCYPRCPASLNTGQVCGNTTLHQCVQTQAPGATSIYSSRIAICQCAPGYFVNPITRLCEQYCIHGTTPLGWNPDRPTACLCDNTGFTTNNGANPRCDYATCRNNGTWDATQQHCSCIAPYTSASRCILSTCDNPLLPGVHPRGFVVNTNSARQPFQCACNTPFRPVSYAMPYDCDADYCGDNAVLSPFSSAVVDITGGAQCICKGKWTTRCRPFVDSGCRYCMNTTCLHDGQPSILDASVCACPFPFSNGALGVCEINQCGNVGCDSRAIYSPYDVQCQCKPGYTGSFCENAICNASITIGFDAGRGTCICAPGLTGSACNETICQHSGEWSNALNQCTCPSAQYVGVYCDVLVPSRVVINVPVVTVRASSTSALQTFIQSPEIWAPLISIAFASLSGTVLFYTSFGARLIAAARGQLHQYEAIKQE